MALATLFELPYIDLKKLTETTIRALWWKQPFASLMLHGKIETRKRATLVRGKVLICATKKAYDQADVFNMCGELQKNITKIFSDNYDSMTSGQAIAIADLVDCRRMTKEDEVSCFVKFREPWIEEVPCITKNGLLGVKFMKRELWCWIFENVEAIEPFDIDGKQGWAILTEEDKAKIKIKRA